MIFSKNFRIFNKQSSLTYCTTVSETYRRKQSMNIQLAFAFGMLTMVAISMLVVIVVGMVKVIRLAREVQHIQSELDRTVTHIYHKIEQDSAGLHGRVDSEVRSIVEEVRNMQRYTDSRFDKFENRIKVMPAKPMEPVEPNTTAIDTVIEKTKNKKQLLKD